MLSFDQSAEKNKAEFVERLIAAGWTKEEAEEEYDTATATDDEEEND